MEKKIDFVNKEDKCLVTPLQKEATYCSKGFKMVLRTGYDYCVLKINKPAE